MLTEIARAFCIALRKTLKELYWNHSIMDRNQARDILNINNDCTSDEVERAYKNMRARNFAPNKGSPYLQDKIETAYRILLKTEDA